MKLYLLRHASAQDIATSDAARALTRDGREEARVAGQALAALGVKPDHILTSPLARAHQRAGVVARQRRPSRGRVDRVARRRRQTSFPDASETAPRAPPLNVAAQRDHP